MPYLHVVMQSNARLMIPLSTEAERQSQFVGHSLPLITSLEHGYPGRESGGVGHATSSRSCNMVCGVYY